MNDDEREAAQLLGQLKVNPSAGARERAFARLRQEFRAAGAPAARRGPPRWAIAAGIAALALAGATWMSARPVPVVAQVEALDGGVETRGPRWYDGSGPLAAGMGVAEGQTLSVASGGGVLLRISPQLSVRLAAGTRARLSAPDELELSVGTVFVDATPGAHAPLRVITPQGSVTHLGTQYLVRAGRGEVELAVREGRAQLITGKSSAITEAGHWLLRRDGNSEPFTGELAAGDARFEWIAALPSTFRLEGATLAQFLAWFHRESGITLVYSEGVDAGHFAQVRLKGSIENLKPIEALGYVLATADLAWHREGAKVIIGKPSAPGG